MKIIFVIARILLGLVFVVFGANGFLHFIPMPPPTGLAGQFIGAMFQTHYIHIVWVLQIAGGLLLLIGLYVPLALVILGPIIVNIVLFHLLMAPSGLPLAIGVTVLWVIVAVGVRTAFSGLFLQKSGA